MEATVYIDLFFMINFSMDFLCLYLTSKLLSHKLSLPRGLFAAAAGGAYAVLSLLLPTGYIPSFIIDALACIILCLIAFFRPREWRRQPLYILVYTAVSMALGGFMTALFNLFNRSGIFDGLRESDGDGISVWLFALLAAVSAALTLIGGRFFGGRMSAKEAELEITYGGKTAALRGMTDSGNLLREPISGLPCIVADISALSPILPEAIQRLALDKSFSGFEDIPLEARRRVVLIPADTASGGGMLLGLRADRVSLTLKGKKRDADAVIALSRLSGLEGGAAALIPSCLMI